MQNKFHQRSTRFMHAMFSTYQFHLCGNVFLFSILNAFSVSVVSMPTNHEIGLRDFSYDPHSLICCFKIGLYIFLWDLGFFCFSIRIWNVYIQFINSLFEKFWKNSQSSKTICQIKWYIFFLQRIYTHFCGKFMCFINLYYPLWLFFSHI